jgi:hypothetical protein
MAELHVLTALHARYAETMGALRQSEREAERLRGDLAHIEAVIRLYRPEWSGDRIKPRRTYSPSRWGGKGEGMRTAMAVLREASEPLTARQIVVLVLERLGHAEPSSGELNLIAGSFNSSLRNRIGRGVRLIDGYPKRWEIERERGMLSPRSRANP